MLLNETKSFDYKGYNSKGKFILGKIGSFINTKGSQSERENWSRRKNAVDWYKKNPDRISEYGKKEIYDGDAYDKFHGSKSGRTIKAKITRRNNQFKKVDNKFEKDKSKRAVLKYAAPLSVPVGLIPVPGSGPAFLALAAGGGAAVDKLKERKIMRSSVKAKRANDLVNRDKNRIRLQEKLLALDARHARQKQKLETKLSKI